MLKSELGAYLLYRIRPCKSIKTTSDPTVAPRIAMTLGSTVIRNSAKVLIFSRAEPLLLLDFALLELDLTELELDFALLELDLTELLLDLTTLDEDFAEDDDFVMADDDPLSILLLDSGSCPE